MSTPAGFSAEDRWSIDATERLLEPIIRDVFSAQRILYTWNSKLDRYYGVDALLHTPRRNVALAIRVRGYYYYHRFGDITLRHESLRTMGKALETQKSIARFMLYAWVDTDRPEPPTSVVDWHVIYLQRLLDRFLTGELSASGPYANHDGSSNLVAFSVPDLQRLGLIYRSAPVPLEVPF